MYCKEVRRPMHSILIVDDETSIRMMLFDYLEDKYEIHTAENAEIGLRLCKERRFDLVISDVNMPGMKGPEFLFEVKKIAPGDAYYPHYRLQYRQLRPHGPAVQHFEHNSQDLAV